MDIKNILSMCDHTILTQTAVWNDVKKVCDDGIKYGTASVCIPPSYVKQAKEYTGGKLKICTVIGFPNGYNTTSVKCFETEQAIADGADEIDMVINLGWVKSSLYNEVLNEIKSIKKVCGDKILKVIIETCLLDNNEKKELCKIVSQSGADYIKTSTGFSTAGAKIEDIELFSENISGKLKIKAAGGISSVDEAEKLIQAGATRLGTSRIVKIADTIIKNG